MTWILILWLLSVVLVILVKKLTSLNYLIREQLDFKDNKTLLLKKIARSLLLTKETKIEISEICWQLLIEMVNKKFKSNNLELSNDVKRKYEIKHPIDWWQERCCIWTLEINPKPCDADEKAMYYADFIIFKEYKFLRNIFSSEELANTDSMKDVKTFHENFVRFSNIVVFSAKQF